MLDPQNHPPHDESESPRFPPGTGWLLGLTAFVGLLTLGAMLYPFNFRSNASGGWLTLMHVGWMAVLGNILLFVPMGVSEGWLGHNVFRRHGVVIVVVAVDAALLSLIGETAQLWIVGRDSSMVELLANTIGGTLGGLLGGALAPALNAALSRR